MVTLGSVFKLTRKDVYRAMSSSLPGCRSIDRDGHDRRAAHRGQGGLSLDRDEQLMVGGTSGKVVVPGRPNQSLRYQRIAGQKQPRLPLCTTPLSQNRIAAGT